MSINNKLYNILFKMADVKYGFVDDGNIAFISKKGCECEEGNKEALDKVNEIIEDAPEELNSFKEVADKFDKLQVTEINLSEYAKKSDLDDFLTKEDAKHYVTSAEFETEADNFATKVALSDEVAEVNRSIDEKILACTEQSKVHTNKMIQGLIGDAPETLNTIKELADAIKDNDDIVTTIKESITKKIDRVEVEASYQLKGDYALKSEIPLLDGYATEDYVNEAIESVDHSMYALKTEIPEAYDDTVIQEDIESLKEGKQDKGNYLTYKDENGRKVVTLGNTDIFGAVANTEPLENKVDVSGWISLVQLNKWNVVDLGSPKTLTNINIPNGVRPTVQEASQSGSEAHKIAYLDDFDGVAKFTKTEWNGDKKRVLTLDNMDLIQGKVNHDELENKVQVDKNTVSLIQLNKWNVVDLGSADTLTNINTPNGVRPTVQEKNQSGPEAHKIAYVDDIDEISKENAMLKDMVKNLIKAFGNKESDSAFVTGNMERNELDNTTVDYIANNGSISFYDVDATNIPFKLSAPNGDVTIADVTTEGKTMDETLDVKKNNFFVEADGNINIKGCKFEAECYNGVHMNNNGVCSSDNVTVENTSLKKANNNGFNVLATKDNAVITYKNVTIGEAKNAFRFSNFKEARGVVVNFENVIVDKVNQKFMLLEDYITRKDGNYPDNFTDLFDAEHMTFNFKNVVVGGVKLTSENILDNLHIVVGKPSLGNEIDVTDICKDGLKINFFD